MTQPTIEDFQVDLSTSLKDKIDLDDLKDVNVPNPANGEALVWNNSANKWEADVVSGVGGSVVSSGSSYKVLDSGVVYYHTSVPPVGPGSTVNVALPIANTNGVLLYANFARITDGSSSALQITNFTTTTVRVKNTFSLTTVSAKIDIIAV